MASFYFFWRKTKRLKVKNGIQTFSKYSEVVAKLNY